MGAPMSSRIPNRVITGLVPVISTGKAQRSLDRDGRVKPGHDNVRVAQAARASLAFSCSKAQSSQAVSASRSSALDRRAAPDAQARRGVAVGADVVGDALLRRAPPRCPWRRALPPRPAGTTSGSTTTGTRRCWSASPGPSPGGDPRRARRPSRAITLAFGVRAGDGRRGRRWPSAHSQRVDVVLDAQHRRRVDGLALEYAFDELAALGHAEDLGQRPGRRVALQPRDGAGRQDQHAVRGLAAQNLLPGEGHDIELWPSRAAARRPPRWRRRWSAPRGRRRSSRRSARARRRWCRSR